MSATPDPEALLRASDDLLRRLEELGVVHDTIEHEPLHTVALAARVRRDMDAAATRNLFVRDKRGSMWTITALAEREIDLLRVRDQVGARGRLSFASERRLTEFLGILPGCVSPLAVCQDAGGKVRVVLDEALRSHTHLLAHPLINTRTTRLSIADLERALVAFDHPPLWIGLDA